MQLGHALASVVFCLPFILTGCALQQTATPTPESGIKLKGNVHGGQQPIVGAHVYLFAANTTGYGGPGIAASGANASLSLLNATTTGLADSIGAYVMTDAHGSFTITGDYNCIPNTQVYLYALGGNPGAGVNSAAGLLAALGSCPSSGSFLASLPFIQVNEVTTIAAAYAFAGFATDATHVSSSGTPLAQIGIANAFANATNLASVSTGAALTTTPAGNGVVPQTEINTLANILAACINSTGPASSSCSTFLSSTLSNGSGGVQPTDTATAAINIAHNPAVNIATLYALLPADAPFQPTLPAAPNDFSILLIFSGGGLSSDSEGKIAIDGNGNLWITDYDKVVEFSSSGAILSGASGYSEGQNQWGASDIAIDLAGNAWVTNIFTNSVAKFSNTGSLLSGTNGFPGYSTVPNGPSAVAIDSSDNVWIGDSFGTPLFKLSNSGAVLSGAKGYSGGGLDDPIGIGIDGSGNAWVANYYGGSNVTKLSNSGAILSGPNGYTGGGIAVPYALAIDSSGSIWVASHSTSIYSPGGVTKLSNTGSTLIGAAGYHNTGMTYAYDIAIDGSGNAWVTSDSPPYTAVFEISSSGATLSTAVGYGFAKLSFPIGVAIDGSGNVWVGDQGGVVEEFIGAATPVITPLVAGLPLTPTTDGTSNLGTRP